MTCPSWDIHRHKTEMWECHEEGCRSGIFTPQSLKIFRCADNILTVFFSWKAWVYPLPSSKKKNKFCRPVPRLSLSLSDMTNYKSAFGKVCRIPFKSMPIPRIKNRHTFKSMPILNSSYHAVKYAELRIGILLKVCRFVIRHITQTQTQTETELLRRHSSIKVGINGCVGTALSCSHDWLLYCQLLLQQL